MSQSLSGALVDQVTTLLTGSTTAGANVFKARTWPLTLETLPALMVDPIYKERREATGKAAAEFQTTTTVTIRGRVTVPAGANDVGSVNLSIALETFKRQIENVLMLGYANRTINIENFPSIDTDFDTSSDAKQPVGEVEMTVTMSFKEAAEDFDQPSTDDLQTVAITTDLLDVFDKTGTYASPPFPSAVKPAPRTSGPDGRTEGGGALLTNLDQ